MGKKNKNKNSGGGGGGGSGSGSKTKAGVAVSDYIVNTLDKGTKASDAALAAGFPDQSSYTKAYLAGVPSLYMYGDEEYQQALDRSGGMYGKYLDAAGYDKTNFADLEGAYGRAGQYAPTDYGDIENEYTGIGNYTPEQYGGIEAQYAAQMGYDPRQYADADYTAKNIKERMSPYEELVSRQAEKRLKRGYDEAGAERQAQALRAGAFGGSGAAVQEEVARRNYLDQAEEMNARNLQAAFESGADLYGRELADNLAAGQAEEASRQFGRNLNMSAIQGQLAAKNAQQQADEFKKQLQLDVMSGKITARQAEEASRQFAKNAQFTGLAGQMDARQQTAAQNAAAKEAQFTGLAGASSSIGQQADLAQGRKNMQIANLGAMSQAGNQQDQYAYDKTMFPLNVAAGQANLMSPLSGGMAQVPMQKQRDPSALQQGLSIASNVVGTAVGSGFFRDGGLAKRYAEGGLAQGMDLYQAGALVHRYMNGGIASLYGNYNQQYNGGGLAELEPEYYSGYEF